FRRGSCVAGGKHRGRERAGSAPGVPRGSGEPGIPCPRPRWHARHGAYPPPMISRIGLALSEFFRRTAPDPFVLAVLLTVVAGVLAFTLGDFPALPDDTGRGTWLLDAWRGSQGLWAFLAFSMQM